MSLSLDFSIYHDFSSLNFCLWSCRNMEENISKHLLLKLHYCASAWQLQVKKNNHHFAHCRHSLTQPDHKPWNANEWRIALIQLRLSELNTFVKYMNTQCQVGTHRTDFIWIFFFFNLNIDKATIETLVSDEKLIVSFLGKFSTQTSQSVDWFAFACSVLLLVVHIFFIESMTHTILWSHDSRMYEFVQQEVVQRTISKRSL